MSRATVIATCVGAAACISAAGRGANPPLPTLSNVVVPEMRAYHVPDVAVAVVRRGAIVVDTVFSSSAADAEPLFEAASLSKPVFATLVMMLARQGRLDLDAPLGGDDDWPTMADPRGKAITARMVLSHTSGLPNGVGNAGPTLAFDPGARWQYSGAAYRYLQRVVEHATGQPLDVLATRMLFVPLDMQHTGFTETTTRANDLPGHDRDGRVMPNNVFRRASAASSLRTTAVDYARFLRAVLTATDDTSSIVRTADVAAMLTPAVVVVTTLGLSWGLGWAVAGPVFFHWGSNPGSKSFVMGDRSTGTGIVILTDGDNGLELAPAIVRRVTGRDYRFFKFYMLHPSD